MLDTSHQSPASMREDYRLASLHRVDLAASPIDQFAKWFDEAVAAGVREPNALVLATMGLDGLPNSRTVLMKDYDERGVTFYTNYSSHKGQELIAHPVASITFLWKEIERQIHVRGHVAKVSREESLAYFQSRPYDSRIGAWSSTQSEVIPDREWLNQKAAEFEAKYPDTGSPNDVPLPDFWGGFRVSLESVEFWQGGHGRKHDRFLYQRDEAGNWRIDRLSP